MRGEGGLPLWPMWPDARGANENQPTLSKVALREIRCGHSLAHLVGDDAE